MLIRNLCSLFEHTMIRVLGSVDTHYVRTLQAFSLLTDGQDSIVHDLTAPLTPTTNISTVYRSTYKVDVIY